CDSRNNLTVRRSDNVHDLAAMRFNKCSIDVVRCDRLDRIICRCFHDASLSNDFRPIFHSTKLPDRLEMRLKHLYYQTDTDRVSVWNCDISDISWLSARNNITGGQPDACALLNPRSRAKSRI